MEDWVKDWYEVYCSKARRITYDMFLNFRAMIPNSHTLQVKLIDTEGNILFEHNISVEKDKR